MNKRIETLKNKMISEPRYVSIEQALIITETYKQNANQSKIIKRAMSLKNTLLQMEITVENEERIVGNRTKGVRNGVVFPESGLSWIDAEFETLPTRPQDTFHVHQQDIGMFRNVIKPFWEGLSLEDEIKKESGGRIESIEKVVKINQKDHAQGHICPNCKTWLALGPEGLRQEALSHLQSADENDKSNKDFYRSVILVMEGAQQFMLRYRDLLAKKAEIENDYKQRNDLLQTVAVCKKLASHPPDTFHEAIQSIWFLFVILHMESNASSFSPGRMDQFLYPYYIRDKESGRLHDDKALELIECLCLKFNQIVYLRNAHSAKFFAGFPIGFNIVIGGQNEKGEDVTNELSYLFLKAQWDLGLPQPNLSVRLHTNTPEDFLEESIRVVAKGNGMPQFFNDNAVIPSLLGIGIDKNDAMDYAVVGCVELTTQGNNLGWSDAAMFNLNKTLELALNHGKCLLTGKQLSTDFGGLDTYESFEDLEHAFAKTIDFFIEKMITACEIVEKAHIDSLPTPFLSAVVDNCMEKGIDVTAGGAAYNFSGIQMIQIANLADSLAAIKLLVFDEHKIDKKALLHALRHNFENDEVIRVMLLNRAPKYGNDIPWVDYMALKWASYFREKLKSYRNYRAGRCGKPPQLLAHASRAGHCGKPPQLLAHASRASHCGKPPQLPLHASGGGIYHTGMYTVSAHVPMGENVGASPDGRFAGHPLADGGLSPVYGRDINGPTAVLKSVSRLDNQLTSNGGLLNMKFLPEFFQSTNGIEKFALFLRTFVDLEIPHIQFNVLRQEDLLKAKENPEQYRGLTVRVAGYTAYFTELADELQNEIIARTSYGGL